LYLYRYSCGVNCYSLIWRTIFRIISFKLSLQLLCLVWTGL